MLVRNDKAAGYLLALSGLLDFKGKLGCCVARNRRLLVTELQEYLQCRDEAIIKHGDDGANINPSMEGWEAFVEDMKDLDAKEREYDFDRITWEEASEQLTARQLISIEWMLEG